MKKIFCLFVATVMLLTLVACGSAAVTESEPEVSEEVSEPQVSEPQVSEPEASEPEVSEPEASEPEVSEPEASEPEVSEPEAEIPEWELTNLRKTLKYGGTEQWEFSSHAWVIISQEQDRALLMEAHTRELCLFIADQQPIHLATSIVDYTVAYDTVYWLTLDSDVWACDWWETAEKYLFCEDAIDVSPFTDECEGAIVTSDKANVDYGYGGLPIYSPYGIK